MSKTAAVFNKKKFINEVTETVRHMYRKQLKEASQQEIFQAVSYVVKDVVIDDWLATQQAFDDQDPKIVSAAGALKTSARLLPKRRESSSKISNKSNIVQKIGETQ